MKKWYLSKLNWVGVGAMLLGLQDFVTNFNFSGMTAKDWITFGIGFLTVIIRTWFTSTSIGNPDK